MANVLGQKQTFGLINDRLKIKETEPEFMFAYAYDDNSTVEEQDLAFQEEYNKIGESIKVIRLNKNSKKLLD